MNRVISSRISAHSAYGRVCALLMLVMLIGLCLVLAGVAVDLVMLRTIGLGTFVVAATSVLAMVLVAYLLERRD